MKSRSVTLIYPVYILSGKGEGQFSYCNNLSNNSVSINNKFEHSYLVFTTKKPFININVHDFKINNSYHITSNQRNNRPTNENTKHSFCPRNAKIIRLYVFLLLFFIALLQIISWHNIPKFSDSSQKKETDYETGRKRSTLK